MQNHKFESRISKNHIKADEKEMFTHKLENKYTEIWFISTSDHKSYEKAQENIIFRTFDRNFRGLFPAFLFQFYA